MCTVPCHHHCDETDGGFFPYTTSLRLMNQAVGLTSAPEHRIHSCTPLGSVHNGDLHDPLHHQLGVVPIQLPPDETIAIVQWTAAKFPFSPR